MFLAGTPAGRWEPLAVHAAPLISTGPARGAGENQLLFLDGIYFTAATEGTQRNTAFISFAGIKFIFSGRHFFQDSLSSIYLQYNAKLTI